MNKIYLISLLLVAHGVFDAAEAACTTPAGVPARLRFAPDVTEEQKAAFPVVAELIVDERPLKNEVDNFMQKFYRDIFKESLYFKESLCVDKWPTDMSPTKLYHNELLHSVYAELTRLGCMGLVLQEYLPQGIIGNTVEDYVARIARSRGYLRAAHKNLIKDKKNNHDSKLQIIESWCEKASAFLEKHTVPKWVRRKDDRNSITLSFCERRYLHRRLTYELAAVALGEHLDGLKLWIASESDLWLQHKKLAEARSHQSADEISALEVTLHSVEQSLMEQERLKISASKDIVGKMLKRKMDNSVGGEISPERIIAKGREILLVVRKNKGLAVHEQIAQIIDRQL